MGRFESWILVLTFVGTLSSPLQALECDQLTKRDRYADLPDSLVRVNEKTNQLLTKALEKYNTRFSDPQTRPSPDKAYRYLALLIHNEVAREDRIFVPTEEESVSPKLDLLSAMSKIGLGQLQEWLENREVQGPWVVHLNPCLYSDWFPASLDGSSVLKVAGVLAGPDKFDHFFDQGYEYWRISDYGRDDRAAVDYGVAAEWGYFGLEASGIFSYADLKANWAGYQFYRSLADFFELTEEGLMVQPNQFDWAAWVDQDWDELLNPSSIAEATYKSMLGRMAAQERDFAAGTSDYSYQQTYEVLIAGGYRDHVAQVTREGPSLGSWPTTLKTYADLLLSLGPAP